ncbi:MAG: DUF1801 domain-containing protein [Pseudomonadota bacterium]
MRPAPPIADAVAPAFDAMPDTVANQLKRLRSLIFSVAEAEDVGPLTETLKWGEPSYLTQVSRAGTTIRLGWSPKTPDRCGMYVNCQTTLLDQYRERFANHLELQGNRAVMIDPDRPLAEAPLATCIALALTYHRSKSKRQGA